jgi:hypothetical protein
VKGHTAAVLMAALLTTACSDRPNPVGLESGNAGVAIAVAETMNATGDALPAALIPVQDALDRVLDVLPEGPNLEALRDALVSLTKALVEEDDCAIRESRRDAEHALRDLSRRQPDEYEADFEAVKLALGTVEQAGQGRC